MSVWSKLKIGAGFTVVAGSIGMCTYVDQTSSPDPVSSKNLVCVEGGDAPWSVVDRNTGKPEIEMSSEAKKHGSSFFGDARWADGVEQADAFNVYDDTCSVGDGKYPKVSSSSVPIYSPVFTGRGPNGME